MAAAVVEDIVVEEGKIGETPAVVVVCRNTAVDSFGTLPVAILEQLWARMKVVVLAGYIEVEEVVLHPKETLFDGAQA